MAHPPSARWAGPEGEGVTVEDPGIGYVCLDPEGKVLDADSEYLRLTGRKGLEDLLGANIAEWAAPPDQARIGEALRRCVATGSIRGLEIDHVGPEGDLTPLEIDAKALRTPDGVSIMALCKDVTERRNLERSRRDMEDLFNLFMEFSTAYVFFKDADLRPIRLSRNYEEMLGRPLEQILGKTMDELFPSELAKGMIEDDRRIIHENVMVKVDEEMGGRSFTTIKFPVVREGRPPFLAGITLDITDRKRAEEALRASEARFRTIFEQSTLGIVVATAGGRFLQANPAFQAFVGYSEAELQAMTLRDLTHPDFLREELDVSRACLAGEIPHYKAEKMYLAKDGHGAWGRAHVSVLRDDSGQAHRLIELVEDISERKLAEEALLRSENKFRSLFEAMIEGVGIHEIVYDAHGRAVDSRLVDLNPAYEAQTGISRDECLGRLGSELYPTVTPSLLEEFLRVVKTGKPRAFEAHSRRLGKFFRVCVFMPHQGMVATVFEDITERKRDEDERRKLEAEIQHAQQLDSLGSLAGGVAHDMNNVLQAIQGMASVLKVKCAQEPAVLSGLDIILNASNRGRDLVKNLTDFARKGLQESSMLDLNQIVRREVDMLQHTTLQRIEFQMELEEPLPQILGDPSSIGNALMNVCVNALDAMPQRGVLRFRTRKPDDGFVELTVEDSGGGMSSSVLHQAAEPFFTTKPLGKGTGLGLSIVYGTMKAHGGSMELQSEEGKGTRVILRFRAVEEARGPSVRRPQENPGGKTEKPMKILLVDDDDLIRDSFPDLMAILGHQVVATAVNGMEGIRMIEDGLDVDVVFLDHNMPGFTGVETLARIRSLRPNLPVVFCTGHLDDSVRERLDGCARVQVLMKPYSLKDIRPVLGAVAQD